MVEMNFYEMSVPSSDGKHKLSGFVCEPAGEILGHVQIIHGMTDYTLRYRDLMEKLARAGYLAFGYDQLGHGHTATSNEELGFISAKDGWKFLVEDATLFYQAICQKYIRKTL